MTISIHVPRGGHDVPVCVRSYRVTVMISIHVPRGGHDSTS